jgi:hypothetical protein
VFWLINFLNLLKKKILNFIIFVATKNGRTKKSSPSSFGAAVGSVMDDPLSLKIARNIRTSPKMAQSKKILQNLNILS